MTPVASATASASTAAAASAPAHGGCVTRHACASCHGAAANYSGLALLDGKWRVYAHDVARSAVGALHGIDFVGGDKIVESVFTVAADEIVDRHR